jgi:flagellar protein FliS
VSDDDVLELYERGLAACRARDARGVRLALMGLLDALNFEYEEAAVVLCRLYETCLGHLNAGRFETLLVILGGLREARLALRAGSNSDR